MAARRETRGFTLVELMIVVAIIGLLITLLVPVVTKATAIILRVQTERVLKDIALGLEAFRNDFQCYPPSYEERDANDNGNIEEEEKHYGAANLALYLRGPVARGWGTTAGGRMPFPCGRARKAYGPYYEAEEAHVVYFTDADHTVAGFTDAYQPVGLRDDVVVGRILYFRLDPQSNKFLWTDNRDPDDITDLTKQAFMGYTSALQTGNYYITAQAWQCPDPEHTDLFEEDGTCPRCGKDLVLVQLQLRGTKRYLLVSPGPDRRYGKVYTETDGGIVPDTDGTEGEVPDDIWYAR